MSDIFISYASEDRKLADEIVALLKSAGISVWFDKQLSTGREFDEDIERELRQCKLVLVLWTDAAIRSRWVKDEASVALKHEKYFPVKLTGEALPLGFRTVHAFVPHENSSRNLMATDIANAAAAQLGGIISPKAKVSPESKALFQIVILVTYSLLAGGIAAVTWELLIDPFIVASWANVIDETTREVLQFLFVGLCFSGTAALLLFLIIESDQTGRESPEKISAHGDRTQ